MPFSADFSNWTETDTAAKIATDAAANHTVGGGYGIRCVHNNTTTVAYFARAIAAAPRALHVRFWIRFINGAAFGGGRECILDQRTTLPDTAVALYLNNDGTNMELKSVQAHAGDGAMGYADICAETDETWHKVELEYKFSNAGAGYHVVKIDDATVRNQTGLTTDDVGWSSFRLGLGTFISTSVGTCTIDYDDVLITDGTSTLLDDDFQSGSADVATQRLFRRRIWTP